MLLCRKNKTVLQLLCQKSTYAFLFLCILTACGGEKNRLRVEGTFQGFNQGELYIYGAHGTRQLDTVAVAKGQFLYRIPLEDTLTLIMLFPNQSELPIFATPGAVIKVKGDASHLLQTEVKGTADNDLMTKFRLRTSDMTPPQQTEEAEKFIRDHADSPVSAYLLDRYFIRTPQPDYAKAAALATVIREALPADTAIAALSRQLDALKSLKKGEKIPAFTVVDVNGRNYSSADLYAKANVISLWASWSYESVRQQTELRTVKKELGDRLRLLSVCIDASPKDCRRVLTRDSITWPTVCDGRMWRSPVILKTGLSYLPDNILLDDKGRIVAVSLSNTELLKQIRQLAEK